MILVRQMFHFKVQDTSMNVYAHEFYSFETEFRQNIMHEVSMSIRKQTWNIK